MTLGAATEVLYVLGDRMPEGLWVGARYGFLGKDSPINVAFRDNHKKRYILHQESLLAQGTPEELRADRRVKEDYLEESLEP